MLLNTVKKTIKDYNLLEKDDKVLIAYSGGADSTCLLSTLLELREDWSLEISLGHFNHRLRPQADEDERFVKEMAQEYSLPLIVGSKDVRSHAKKHKLNLEEAGRKLRYDFLRKTALKIGGAKIATGHTMNDQVETFLMRLMRGSGLRGLASIFPVVGGVIIRPLIRIERGDIEAYLKKGGIRFRVDESNYDRRFLRNRIRLELIPYIQKNFEPQILPHIERIVSIIQEEEALLDETTKKEIQRAVLEKNEQIQLDLTSLSSLHRGLARRVVRDFILKLKGDLRGISFDDVEAILTLGQGKESHLKKDLVLRREQNKVFLKGKNQADTQYECSWNGEKPLKIKELNVMFEGKRKRKSDRLPLEFDDRSRAFLDREKLKFPLVVRNRREGDRYHPLGAPGSKKIKEIMRAKGILIEDRSKRPVFLSQDEIIWILGLPVSEKFKITEKTRNVFIIRKL